MNRMILRIKSSAKYIKKNPKGFIKWAINRIIDNVKNIWKYIKSFFQQNDDSSDSSDSQNGDSSNSQQNDDSSNSQQNGDSSNSFNSSNSPPQNNYDVNNYRRQKRYLVFRYVPIISTR
ncbi:unnamed protein product [Rhizophagus irregularis]|uniref:Uncharacterized protein n=2 Tax=Rhizophagus irregularis TaxID=588596 RepID=A0A2N1NXQ6_9GLOM|nr:hypothetical protein RhiirC2_769961 [Rhizophagus irregularis]CAB4381236.1 unnamed protein product [Rhizophagus irregularis]CAB4445956.1 unnamed protein product [Rhizophagus irregularis]CAB5387026.1 unnamed protein product [Rhizophagus irregularis]